MIQKMLGGGREKAMKAVVGNLIDGEAGDIFTGLIAEKEIQLLKKVSRLHAAAGVDSYETLPNKEDRQEQMKGLIEALISDEIPEFYFESIIENQIDNPEQARKYLDLEADEWTAKIDKIEQSYRKQGDDRPRSEILADYVNRRFGVSVSRFVTGVVIWKPHQRQNVAQTILLGNLEAVGQGIDDVTEALEEETATDG